ncbi:MAG: hypothetical protein O2958_06145 [Gemmatimonadetes bacterium]|nr:hypothetical protein [Gemmatimonadota bacterium]
MLKQGYATGIPTGNRAVRRLAMRVLLPGMLLNVTIANQVWEVGPFLVGQFLFWPLIASASLVVLLSFGPSSVIPPLIIGGLLMGRALGANSWEGLPYLIYGVPLASLFVAAGGSAALETPDRVRRQLRLYFVLTVPFMLLQVAGAGSWTLALNTEALAVPEWQMAFARVSHPTLFVPYGEGQFSIGQSRPAGFMHANNFLSLAIVFGLAAHWGRIRSRRLTWGDAVMCAAVVMAMAKIVMLTLVVMLGWLFWSGSTEVRSRMRRVLVLFVGLYSVYALLFPGLFFHHFRWFHISYSVLIRLNDFVATLDPSLRLVGVMASMLEGTPQLVDASNPDAVGVLSGYAFVSRWLPVLVPLALVASVLLRRGLRDLREQSVEASRTAELVLIACVLFPAAVPIFRSSVYWYFVGFGVAPIAWRYSPHFRSRMAFGGNPPSRDPNALSLTPGR